MLILVSFIFKFLGFFFLKKNYLFKIIVFFFVVMKCDENSNFLIISYEMLNIVFVFNIM